MNPGVMSLTWTDEMAEHVIPELDRAGLRNFGLSTGAMIAFLFGLFFPWVFEVRIPVWPWVLFAILAVMGLAVPDMLRPVYKGWMKFAQVLSKIMTPLVLGIVFYGLVLPMGLIMRVFGNDPMNRDFSQDAESYRVKSQRAERDGIERPF